MAEDEKEPEEPIAMTTPTSFLKETGQFSGQKIDLNRPEKPDTLLGVIQEKKDD